MEFGGHPPESPASEQGSERRGVLAARIKSGPPTTLPRKVVENLPGFNGGGCQRLHKAILLCTLVKGCDALAVYWNRQDEVISPTWMGMPTPQTPLPTGLLSIMIHGGYYWCVLYLKLPPRV